MSKVSRILTFLLAAILALGLGCARRPDDVKISTEIQSKFSQDSGLSNKPITVQASNGMVTLGGVVDSEAQREAASLQAASVSGVKQVVNNLQVGDAANPSVSSAAPRQEVAEVKPAALKPAAKGKTAARHDEVYSVPDPPADNESANDTANGNSEAPVNTTPAAPPDNPPTPPPTPQPSKVTIEQGTQMSVRLIDSIDSEKNQVGDTFHATLNAPLSAEGAEAIPAGTDITGHIVDLRSAGKFAGRSLVVLQLDKITANGRSYDLQTDQYRKEGSSRGKNTAEKVGGGAIIGGIIGAIAGGGKGAAIGTAAGAGVGGGVQAASKSQQIKLPSETVLNFTLQAPVIVTKPQDPDAGRQKLSDSQ